METTCRNSPMAICNQHDFLWRTNVKRSVIVFITAGTWCIFWLGGRTAEPISPVIFSKVQALVKPGADEDKWTQIPWLTNLWEARRRAAAEGKPILLWEMDGHPLGCT